MTLDDLRKIAEQATKGPWEWERPSQDDFPQHDQSLVTTWKEDDGHPETVVHAWGYDASGTEAEPQDRLFIATFNPQKVLELLDQIEQLQAVVRDSHDNCTYQTRLAAVEKLHQPEVLHGKTYCSRSMYQEYAGGPYHGTPWPCDTIKAARGE